MIPGANAQGPVGGDAGMTGAVPGQSTQPQVALDPDKARQIRFMRAMERGVSSVQFDSGAWLAQFDAVARDEHAAAARATRLLLATAPSDGARREQRAAGAGSHSGPRRRLPAQSERGRKPWIAATFSSSRARARWSPLAPALMNQVAWGATPAGADYRKLLLLIELKGWQRRPQHAGAVLRTRPDYALRPKIGIARDQVVRLSDSVGLPSGAGAAAAASGRTASSRCCRVWAIRRPICRISVRSRSGIPHRRANNICRTGGSRARSARRPRRGASPPTA